MVVAAGSRWCGRCPTRAAPDGVRSIKTINKRPQRSRPGVTGLQAPLPVTDQGANTCGIAPPQLQAKHTYAVADPIFLKICLIENPGFQPASSRGEGVAFRIVGAASRWCGRWRANQFIQHRIRHTNRRQRPSPLPSRTAKSRRPIAARNRSPRCRAWVGSLCPRVTDRHFTSRPSTCCSGARRPVRHIPASSARGKATKA